jgi:hypothetical protein
LIGRNTGGFLDEAVDVIFHAADFGQLLALRHIVMDQTKSAIQCHRDGHARFGDGVHVGRNRRNVQVQSVGERGVELRVARKNLGIQRGERDVVERQSDFAVCREKSIRRLVERIVEVGIAHRCHVGKCRLAGGFGKRIF